MISFSLVWMEWVQDQNTENGVEEADTLCIVDGDAHGAAIEAIAIFVVEPLSGMMRL